MQLEGTVKWYNIERGYGFIETAEGDIFVHAKVVKQAGYKTLDTGQRAIVTLEKKDKGMRAVAIMIIDRK